MNRAGLCHDLGMNFVYSLSEGHMVFKLATAKGDIKNASIMYTDKYLHSYGKAGMVTQPMKFIGTSGEKDYYEVVVELDVICVKYLFKVEDYQGEVVYYCDKDIYDEEPKELVAMFDSPQEAREEEIFNIPKWMEDGIVYQIFPDRFNRGSDFVDKDEFDPWDDKVGNRSMLGGSLKGISEKLDYLKDLGINVVYLNPIFMSPSNHKYDTTDYFEIDPNFGTKADFKELIDKAHLMGMKVVIDGVFNHCGTQFFAFQDVVKRENESRYKDWFHIYSFPIDSGYREDGNHQRPSYDTFGYYGGMPKLNMKNPEVRDYIFNLSDYWTKEFGIDGWRLDASDEVSFDFWRAFRSHIKRIDPEVGIIGEIWYDATTWLLGDQYDSVMNYKFRTPVVDFIGKRRISASKFNNHIQFTRTRYKKPTHLGLWNLIDSHDTARFLSLCKEDKRLLKLAVGLQFSMQGNPVIYYGDEVGMFGGDDPDCRKPMVWDVEKQDLDLLNYYKQLIKIRKTEPVLIHGEYEKILVDDDKNFIMFRRFTENEEMYMILNNSEESVLLSELEFTNQDIKETILRGKDLISQKDISNEIKPFTIMYVKK